MPSRFAVIVLAAVFSVSDLSHAEERLEITNGTVTVGIDRDRGGAITWLSSKGYPDNLVNIADPGRLIQQSYYAGRSRDRRDEGQNAAWSPWTWNPIQGGGVGSWARTTKFERLENRLISETIPKLWDMPDEEAAAVMRQETSLLAHLPNAILVECEFESRRAGSDLWGPARPRSQEVPACYFTRNFERAQSYLGNGTWRAEEQEPGPPWGQADPPRRAMAAFTADGQGVAVFSPASKGRWNFGPHGGGLSNDPLAGPCIHIAPLHTAELGPKASYRYRYWLVLGDRSQIAATLDTLWQNHRDERVQVGAAK